MRSELAVVVPTYWTRAGGARAAGDTLYDHPTPVDEAGTLPALLQSLRTIASPDFVLVVLVAVTTPEVQLEAEQRVTDLVARDCPTAYIVVGERHLKRFEQVMPGAADLIALRGYSRIRNLQLLVPLCLGAECIVALDDDEIVTDSDFLSIASEGLGETIAGKVVAGTSGYYTQDETGRIMLDVGTPGHSSNLFDRKAGIMNAGTKALEEANGELVPTPFCFGGNMIFGRALASEVFFDPSITRGEDIDYLINARLDGHWFFMNKKLRILHRPPSGGSYRDVAHHKVVQDVLRFVYERAKIRGWRAIGAIEEVTADELSPYPGAFLGDDLDRNCLQVIHRVLTEADEADRKWLGLEADGAAFLKKAEQLAADGLKRYADRRQEWRSLTARVQKDKDLAEEIRQEVVVPGTTSLSA